MIKENVIIIYADTWEDLTVKMIGYYHDHCTHYYSGTIEDVPIKLLKFVAEYKNYIFICEEDKPL